MVRALLDGTKTQTRRTIRPRMRKTHAPIESVKFGEPCPYGHPGDRLWVRETTCIAPKHFATPDETCVKDYDGDLRYVSYKANRHSEEAMRDYKLRWTPSIHVPRWASRITLEITEVRSERLQDISEADAEEEGVNMEVAESISETPGRLAFSALWESINGPGSWDANPWVWVVEFKLINPTTNL